ncbi:hypothetical protein ACFWU5_09750 [Nocardia sp. NPDC058640]|uniref:hypothetical protein n=1 Tax=Nocardia sp. NPDC058640 TaxID=3346571 RepID=UPI00365F2E97
MKPPGPESASSYEEALRAARDLAQDPDTVIPYPHHGLENARYGRGFAFLDTIRTDGGDTDGYILVTTTAYGGGLLSTVGRTIETAIAEHLARAEHSHRDIPDSELSPAHHVAIEAYDTGLARIDDLPGRASIDDATADYAEFVLINLRRGPDRGDTGRKVLARNDSLMPGPTAGRRYTQPCPRCEQPALFAARYPRAVCGDCITRATDRTGRRITGFNTDLSGGVIAYYTDTLEDSAGVGSQREECVEVTRTGACFIDGHPATIQEARFGGIVIEMASNDRSRRRWFRRPKKI